MKLTLMLSGLIGLSTLIAGCKSKNPMATDEIVTPQQPPPLVAPQPQPRDEKPPSPKSVNTAIVLSFEVDKTTLKHGQTITFTLKARNTSEEPRSLTFANGQRFDFTATPETQNAAPEPVWRWSEDKIFNMRFGDVAWKAGEEKTFTTKWDGNGRNAAALPPGRYQISAELASQPRLTAAPIAITIAE